MISGETQRRRRQHHLQGASDERIRISGVTSKAADYVKWIKLEVLPFWIVHGIDHSNGLCCERLQYNGSPDTQATLRLRTQFRQIYVMAHAAALGWFPQGLDVASRVWARLLASAYLRDGKPGFIHTMAQDGTAQVSRRDSYDHAFAVLAAAWLFRASGDPAVASVLRQLLEFVDYELTDAHGALKEGQPDSLPYRQNPQMHWFESMLALMETAAHESGSSRAVDHRRLFESKLIDPKTALLAEYFTADWSPVPGEMGNIIEPGHHMEWVWLLRRHDALTGQPPSNLPNKIWQAANVFLDPTLQLLVDEARRDGAVIRSTRRIWLQTELIKADLAEYESGNGSALPRIASGIDRLEHHYLRKPFAQGWIDQLDADGTPIVAPVPASILYHLFVLAVELDRVFGSFGLDAKSENIAGQI